MTYRWLFKVTSSDPNLDTTAIRRLLNREAQPALLTTLIRGDTADTVIHLYNTVPALSQHINANVTAYAQSYLSVSDIDPSILDTLTIEPVLVASNVSQ